MLAEDNTSLGLSLLPQLTQLEELNLSSCMLRGAPREVRRGPDLLIGLGSSGVPGVPLNIDWTTRPACFLGQAHTHVRCSP